MKVGGSLENTMRSILKMSPERFTELLKNSENDKLLIGIGCSFTQGQGALKDEVWEKHNWNIPNTHTKFELEELELEGSWVTQICKNYMPDWTPINLGERGGGNRAAAKYLTSVFPELNLDDPNKEKIVVFMLTGPERYTIMTPLWVKRFHGIFESIWPNPRSDQKMWRAYAEEMYSPKQTMFETYLNIKEVENWCKSNNAKLILVSAFDFSYFRHYTHKEIKDTIDLDWVPDVWYPNNHPSVFHLLLDKDGFDYSIADGGYWEELNYTDKYPKGTEHVSRCCHPNYKGHQVIATEMYNELVSRRFFD